MDSWNVCYYVLYVFKKHMYMRTCSFIMYISGTARYLCTLSALFCLVSYQIITVDNCCAGNTVNHSQMIVEQLNHFQTTYDLGYLPLFIAMYNRGEMIGDVHFQDNCSILALAVKPSWNNICFKWFYNQMCHLFNAL